VQFAYATVFRYRNPAQLQRDLALWLK